MRAKTSRNIGLLSSNNHSELNPVEPSHLLTEKIEADFKGS
jgi:hypothetical protein